MRRMIKLFKVWLVRFSVDNGELTTEAKRVDIDTDDLEGLRKSERENFINNNLEKLRKPDGDLLRVDVDLSYKFLA